MVSVSCVRLDIKMNSSSPVHVSSLMFLLSTLYQTDVVYISFRTLNHYYTFRRHVASRVCVFTFITSSINQNVASSLHPVRCDLHRILRHVPLSIWQYQLPQLVVASITANHSYTTSPNITCSNYKACTIALHELRSSHVSHRNL